MRRAITGLAVLAAVAAGSSLAYAATLGVSATRLTTYGAAATVPKSTCTTGPSQVAYVESSLFGSTNNSAGSTFPVGSWRLIFFTIEDEALVQFDLSCVPANAKVLSAKLSMYLSTAPSGSRTHGAHRITGSWSPGGGVPSIAGGASATTNTGGTGSNSQWDLTGDVQSIVSGGSNYGWAIVDESSGVTRGYYDSSGSNGPVLTVDYWP